MLSTLALVLDLDFLFTLRTKVQPCLTGKSLQEGQRAIEEAVQHFPYAVLYPLRGSILQDFSNMTLAVWKRDEEERQGALDSTTVSISSTTKQ